jgi:hypothetical protein
MVLLGDSHLRGCSEKVSNLLGEAYSVLGITKPNANLKAITLPSNLQTGKYSMSDVIVVCGGTLDVGGNESTIGLWHLTHFVKNNNNTNIILLDVPHRYDLDVTFCVNKEVTVFNRMLQKVMKHHQHTQILNMSVDRSHFTRHGMHMNSIGKIRITEEVAKKIQTLFSSEQVNSSSPLSWKVFSDNTTSQSKDLQSSGLWMLLSLMNLSVLYMTTLLLKVFSSLQELWMLLSLMNLSVLYMTTLLLKVKISSLQELWMLLSLMNLSVLYMTTLLLKAKISGHQELWMLPSLMNLSVLYMTTLLLKGKISNHQDLRMLLSLMNLSVLYMKLVTSVMQMWHVMLIKDSFPLMNVLQKRKIPALRNDDFL